MYELDLSEAVSLALLSTRDEAVAVVVLGRLLGVANIACI